MRMPTLVACAVLAVAGTARSEAPAAKGTHGCDEARQVFGLNAQAGGLLNVRSGPGRGFDVVSQVRLGDTVLTCEDRGDWTQISDGKGAYGWVSSRYLAGSGTSPTIASAGSSAPVAQNGFRSGEKLEQHDATRVSDAFVSYEGQTDGFYYRYYSDGSASLSNSPNILDKALWKISCKTDAMSDQRGCQIHDDEGILFLTLDAGDEFGICAMRHDFPGREALIRLDKDKPVSLGNSGCAAPATLAPALRAASEVTVRSYKWPNDWSVDRKLNLTGLATAFELASFLKARGS